MPPAPSPLGLPADGDLAVRCRLGRRSARVPSGLAPTAAASGSCLDVAVVRDHGSVVREVLASLSPRHRLVVALRLGFVDSREKTYAEIGAVLGVSKARADQLWKAAQKNLRHPNRSRQIRDCL
jgi:DNA-directed RNA polymerase specialized sigma24 family protein